MRGKRGFGILSPSHRACSMGFGVFVEIKCLFSIAPEESFREVAEVFLTEKHSLDTGCGSIRCWTSVRYVLAVWHSAECCTNAPDALALDTARTLLIIRQMRRFPNEQGQWWLFACNVGRWQGSCGALGNTLMCAQRQVGWGAGQRCRAGVATWGAYPQTGAVAPVSPIGGWRTGGEGDVDDERVPCVSERGRERGGRG